MLKLSLFPFSAFVKILQVLIITNICQQDRLLLMTKAILSIPVHMEM